MKTLVGVHSVCVLRHATRYMHILKLCAYSHKQTSHSPTLKAFRQRIYHKLQICLKADFVIHHKSDTRNM